MNIQLIITTINDYAERNELFWVAGLARECAAVLAAHLDELHWIARIAVEHYLEEQS